MNMRLADWIPRWFLGGLVLTMVLGMIGSAAEGCSRPQAQKIDSIAVDLTNLVCALAPHQDLGNAQEWIDLLCTIAPGIEQGVGVLLDDAGPFAGRETTVVHLRMPKEAAKVLLATRPRVFASTLPSANGLCCCATGFPQDAGNPPGAVCASSVGIPLACTHGNDWACPSQAGLYCAQVACSVGGACSASGTGCFGIVDTCADACRSVSDGGVILPDGGDGGLFDAGDGAVCIPQGGSCATDAATCCRGTACFATSSGGSTCLNN